MVIEAVFRRIRGKEGPCSGRWDEGDEVPAPFPRVQHPQRLDVKQGSGQGASQAAPRGRGRDGTSFVQAKR